MSTQGILEIVWAALNSPIGIATVAALALWALNRLYAAKPLWAQFEGAIVSAVRLAEKEIPDDSGNKALRRFDVALRYVLRVFQEVKKRRATPDEVASLREGINIAHNELDADGVLKRD